MLLPVASNMPYTLSILPAFVLTPAAFHARLCCCSGDYLLRRSKLAPDDPKAAYMMDVVTPLIEGSLYDAADGA